MGTQEEHVDSTPQHTERDNLFVPNEEPNGPKLDQLLSKRVTVFRPNNFHQTFTKVDEWNTEGEAANRLGLARSTGFQTWIGRTVFFDQSSTDEPDDDQDMNIEPTDQAIKPKQVRGPKHPTAQERALHDLTHLPYRTWCEICVELQDDRTSIDHNEIEDRRYKLTSHFGAVTKTTKL